MKEKRKVYVLALNCMALKRDSLGTSHITRSWYLHAPR